MDVLFCLLLTGREAEAGGGRGRWEEEGRGGRGEERRRREAEAEEGMGHLARVPVRLAAKHVQLSCLCRVSHVHGFYLFFNF